MNLAIFGSGYVGLVSGACFAEMGNHVTCVDVDIEKIAKLQQGLSPIFEPGLETMLTSNIAAKRLAFTTDAAMAIRNADICFIAVGTPPAEDGSADLTYVIQVARTIASEMNGYKLVVNKSTVPIGSADRVRTEIQQVLASRGEDYTFDVVSNPEFLKEGSAISDCMKPDRIIIGSESAKAIELMRQLYAPYNRNHDKLMLMDVRSAEMTKYAANAMLATKISFMNEMSQIAEKVGADIEQVRLGIGADQRIGYHFIYPGCGYGGSCFPKDVLALKKAAILVGHKPSILDAVHIVNDAQKQLLFAKVWDYFAGQLHGKTLAIWGLAFKPNTDDIREAPSRLLIERLWDHGVKVRLFDPEAMANFKATYGERSDYICCENPEETIIGSDALVIVTEWSCFRSPNFSHLKQNMIEPVIFDGRNLYDLDIMQKLGINYFSVGRQATQGLNQQRTQLEADKVVEYENTF